MIKIKLADENEAVYIALLGRITFKETFQQNFIKAELGTYLDETFNVSKITKSILNENNIYYIVYNDDLPIAYAKIKKISEHPTLPFSKQSQLQKIYVLSEFINKQVGKLMIEEVFKTVARLNTDVLWLVVLNSNERAINFYKNFGFKNSGIHEHTIRSQTFIYDLLIRTE